MKTTAEERNKLAIMEEDIAVLISANADLDRVLAKIRLTIESLEAALAEETKRREEAEAALKIVHAEHHRKAIGSIFFVIKHLKTYDLIASSGESLPKESK